ncbi:MAG: septal ring lytic transglycosylase RlpA family protein [Bacteroidaceae bacterium]|nr:septal ring lytic transglycosylase RlpA family protein [Bacteroidaceae bacterium]
MPMKKRLEMLLLCLLLCLFCEAQEMLKGKASYYSDKLHGRRMANGQLYHRDSMTCAHLRFPFGTMLKVRNPINDRTVIVRVTDRGPYSKRYIIDLSRAAAKKLGILAAGFCQVEITPFHPEVVPYRAEEDSLPEVPELNLQYTPVATYPDPVWQRDSTDTE